MCERPRSRSPRVQAKAKPRLVSQRWCAAAPAVPEPPPPVTVATLQERINGLAEDVEQIKQAHNEAVEVLRCMSTLLLATGNLQQVHGAAAAEAVQNYKLDLE